MRIWVLNASRENNSTAMCQKVREYYQELPKNTLKTNPRHCEEESQNIYSINTSVNCRWLPKLFVIRIFGLDQQM